eukprot:jgi/Psemu1/34269/gm1.34269_g
MKKPKALPSLSIYPRDGRAEAFGVPSSQELGPRNHYFLSCLSSFMVRYSGVLGVEEPHQSIPNLVVKLYCGDDTVGELRGLEHVATNHGVGGSNPSSPTTGPKGKYLSLWEIDDCIKDAVLIHLRILNWLVVNSPRAMEQRIIQDLHRGIDGHFFKSRRTEWDTMR